MRRRSRPLTSDERRLWAQVARGIKPLKGRTPDLEPVAEPSAATDVTNMEPSRSRPVQQTGTRTTAPPLVPLERRTVAALRRGRQGIDAVIDLHGLRQADAHRALH